MAVLVVAGTFSRAAAATVVLAAAGAVAVVCGAIVAAERATRREHELFGRSATDNENLRRRLSELESVIAQGPREVRVAAAPSQRVEVFVNLARRMQTLSHRALQKLDELENRVEDPDLLKGLFRVDHLSTRLRRQAESLAVIGGTASRRQWSRPVAVYEVLRSAVAEVEDFNRVKIMPPVEGTVDGGAVANLIHLFAELVENATKYSPPHTKVVLRVEAVTAGLAVEIEDRGLGIPRETQRRLNDLLADPERFDADELVRDGRIGLLVVSALARRHKITVRLQTNMFAGTQAVIVIPKELVDPVGTAGGARPAAPPEPARPTSQPSGGTREPMPFPTSDQDRMRGPVRPEHEGVGARQAPPPQGIATSAMQTSGWNDPAPPANGGRRPDLPRRRPQTNLSPELVDAPTPRDDEADIGHNHRLMAAFKRGMASGREADPVDRTDEAGS
ncbi:sensor histidine kinase [Spirillospora sp. CA-142024]|uniref:sensor histidine kinase n=1 Tax=Spirillospora sp. CA-142024 TaxID=3240036 RepID=UPI003D930922